MMTAQLANRVLDYGLAVITAEATHITVCMNEPTNITLASVGNANCIGIGSAVFSQPTDHYPSGGRCVTSVEITDGTILSNGTCGWYAIIDVVHDRLLCHQVLTNGGRQETPGNSWTMPPFNGVHPLLKTGARGHGMLFKKYETTERPGTCKSSAMEQKIRVREKSMTKKTELKLVGSTSTDLAAPPSTLGKAGAKLWRSIMSEYSIEDSGGREMLSQACASMDRIAECVDSIAHDGLVVRTKQGPKENPLLKHELALRSFVVRTLARLGLDVEVVKPVGRPSAGTWKD
jgi:hypothetical protein